MSVTRPRGPLPARVYWRRRLFVLALALAVVFGITRLFAGGSGEEPQPAARPASAESPAGTPSAVSTADAQAVDDASDTRAGDRRRSAVRTPLAEPSGPCQDSDVKVVPAMQENAYAGEDVHLTLELSTFDSPACNWEVSAGTLAVRLTSGSDRIWSSQDCPSAVPEEPVVLRDRKPVLVDVMWSGRRSDPDCSRGTLWAEPGYYHLSAAAMGSEPESQQFRLLAPAPVTITPTPKPKPKAERSEAGGSDEAAEESTSGRAGSGRATSTRSAPSGAGND